MPGRIDIHLTWFDHGRGLALPQQHSSGAAGVDLCAALPTDETLTIGPGRRAMVPMTRDAVPEWDHARAVIDPAFLV